jgi:hypothetical protein
MKKIKIIIVVSVLGIIGITIFWLVTASSPSVRVSYLYTTNDVLPKGAMGVFRLDNHSNRTLGAGGGFYQRKNEQGNEPQAGDYAAVPIGVHEFRQGVTMFQAWVPTNGGPYRLVLTYRPPSPPPLKTEHVLSRWFQASPTPNTALEPTPTAH